MRGGNGEGNVVSVYGDRGTSSVSYLDFGSPAILRVSKVAGC